MGRVLSLSQETQKSTHNIMSKKASNVSSAPNLLNLPLEIRELVYPEILEFDEATVMNINIADSNKEDPSIDLLKYRADTPFKQVCHQLQDEYSEWIFRKIWMRVDCNLCVSGSDEMEPVVFATNLIEKDTEEYKAWKAGIDAAPSIRRVMLRLCHTDDSNWAAHVFIQYFPQSGWFDIQYRLRMIFPEQDSVTAKLEPGLQRLRDLLGQMIEEREPIGLKWRDIERLINALSRPDGGPLEQYLPQQAKWEPDDLVSLDSLTVWEWEGCSSEPDV